MISYISTYKAMTKFNSFHANGYKEIGNIMLRNKLNIMNSKHCIKFRKLKEFL